MFMLYRMIRNITLKSQSSCFFLVVKSQGHHPILENITLDRTDALFLLGRLQTIELFCCCNLAANLLLQVRSTKLNLLQEQCFGLGPLKRKGRSDRWQIWRLKRHRPGHKSELWAILSCGMSVVGFVANSSPSTQKVHVNLEVFLKIYYYSNLKKIIYSCNLTSNNIFMGFFKIIWWALREKKRSWTEYWFTWSSKMNTYFFV